MSLVTIAEITFVNSFHRYAKFGSTRKTPFTGIVFNTDFDEFRCVYSLLIILWHRRSVYQRIYAFINQIVSKSFCFNFDSNDQIRWQICTRRKSSSIVACAVLWPQFIVICPVRAVCVSTRFISGAHKGRYEMNLKQHQTRIRTISICKFHFGYQKHGSV